jgi:hypothetical protein
MALISQVRCQAPCHQRKVLVLLFLPVQCSHKQHKASRMQHTLCHPLKWPFKVWVPLSQRYGVDLRRWSVLQ